MPQRDYLDNSLFFYGMWYYRVRALPIKPLIKEYGEKKAKLLRQLELYARMKWKNPNALQWDIDNFRHQLHKFGLSNIARVYRGNYNLPLIIPVTNFFYDAFSAFPNLNTVYGDRGAGKTIFAWVTAWEVFKRNRNKFDEFQILVYGDVDGLAKEIKKYHPDSAFRKAIIVVEDYEAPEPEPRVGKFILYNELDKPIMSGSSNSQESKTLKVILFRSRHYQFWMFYNVIRIMSVEKTIRISSSFQSFKPLSFYLLGEILEKGVPAVFRSLYIQALSGLNFKEAFTVIPLYRPDKFGLPNMGSRQAFTITPINAPDWLIKATETAEENLETGSITMMKKEKEMVEKAAELYLEGHSLRKIATMMKKQYNFDKNYVWYSDALTTYFSKFGYLSLSEVKEDVKMGRVPEEVYRRKGKATVQSKNAT